MVATNPHTVAILALLDPLTAPVHVTRAPSGSALPYIVLTPDPGTATASAVDNLSDQRNLRFATQYFAAGWEAVDAMQTHATNALLDVKPTVTGRVCGPIHHGGPLPYDRDEDMPDAVILAGDMWTLVTMPAA